MKPGKIFGIVAVLITLAIAAFGQASTDAPKIVITKTEHNFGEVKKGANASYTFTFKNEGKADLEIKRVAPT
jgi:hypothetical protein